MDGCESDPSRLGENYRAETMTLMSLESNYDLVLAFSAFLKKKPRNSLEAGKLG